MSDSTTLQRMRALLVAVSWPRELPSATASGWTVPISLPYSQLCTARPQESRFCTALIMCPSRTTQVQSKANAPARRLDSSSRTSCAVEECTARR